MSAHLFRPSPFPSLSSPPFSRSPALPILTPSSLSVIPCTGIGGTLNLPHSQAANKLVCIFSQELCNLNEDSTEYHRLKNEFTAN